MINISDFVERILKTYINLVNQHGSMYPLLIFYKNDKEKEIILADNIENKEIVVSLKKLLKNRDFYILICTYDTIIVPEKEKYEFINSDGSWVYGKISDFPGSEKLISMDIITKNNKYTYIVNNNKIIKCESTICVNSFINELKNLYQE